MSFIQNKRNLKCAYEMLGIYRQLTPETAEAEEMLHDLTCKLKREIREYTHRPNDEARTIWDDGSNGVVFLLPLPEHIETKEGARGYFLSTEYRECRPSMYDCTGQAFTRWFKIIERRGRFWAYHCVCFDV